MSLMSRFPTECVSDVNDVESLQLSSELRLYGELRLMALKDRQGRLTLHNEGLRITLNLRVERKREFQHVMFLPCACLYTIY